MPIRIPDTLPAAETLKREGVAVMRETDAVRQDIRPLQIGLLNLMPNKIRTETQLARLIGASPLQVELTLVRVGGHQPKNTSAEHLISFYQTWEEIRERKFDGFIVTGAPVEQMPFLAASRAAGTELPWAGGTVVVEDDRHVTPSRTLGEAVIDGVLEQLRHDDRER